MKVEATIIIAVVITGLYLLLIFAQNVSKLL